MPTRLPACPALALVHAEKRPGLVVLLGPFVDTEHPAIKAGAVDKTFDAIFRDEVGRGRD